MDMDYGVCHCDQCLPIFNAALNKLGLTPAEKSKWLIDLQHPTEAMICSLIMATLPSLKSVALYARFYPGHDGSEGRIIEVPKKIDQPYLESNCRSYLAEITCLSQGLYVTRIHSISLPTNLNGLHCAKLLSLKTLSLDYSGTNSLVPVGKGSFTNVTTLKLQARLSDYARLQDWDYTKKTEFLYKGLRRLRAVEFDSPDAVAICDFPPQARTVIIRAANKYVLRILQIHTKAAKARETIELY
jgi:hypothetical protein